MNQNRANQPRTLMVHFSVEASGTDKRHFRLFRHLSDDGFPIFLLTNRYIYQEMVNSGMPLENYENIVVVGGKGRPFCGELANPPFFSRLWVLLKTTWYLCKTLKKQNIDLIHYTHGSMYPAMLAGVLMKKSRVYSFFDNTPYMEFSHGLYRRLFPGFLKKCSQLEFLSQTISDDLNRFCPELAGLRRTVSPCGFVEIDHYGSIAKDPHLVISVSRLSKEKNLDMMLRAMVGVTKSHPQARLVILGRGQEENRLRNLAAELNLEKIVTITYDPNPVNWLKKSCIFLSLQNINNYPSQSLLEAMACENAIIASDVGETRKLVDGTNGWLVDLNEKQISDILIAALNDSVEVSKRGKASREKILRDHRIESVLNYFKHDVYGAAILEKSNMPRQ